MPPAGHIPLAETRQGKVLKSNINLRSMAKSIILHLFGRGAKDLYVGPRLRACLTLFGGGRGCSIFDLLKTPSATQGGSLFSSLESRLAAHMFQARELNFGSFLANSWQHIRIHIISASTCSSRLSSNMPTEGIYLAFLVILSIFCDYHSKTMFTSTKAASFVHSQAHVRFSLPKLSELR